MNTLSDYVSWDGLANTMAIQKLISDFEQLQEENNFMEVVNTDLRAKVKQYEEALQRIIDDPYTESYEAIARKALKDE